ncbi:hypothetical protein [Synechococcus phage S-B68]|nr:hypothetical protein [Synechococcus phage S-B68]
MTSSAERFPSYWNDDIKARLGGEWYDIWWCSVFTWLCLHEGGKTGWWHRHYREDFFKEINAGWLEMNPEPPVTQEELIQSWTKWFTNPYYNERYYE